MAFRGEFGQQPGYRPISGPRMQADGVGFGGGIPREPGKPGQPGDMPPQLPGREPFKQLPGPRGGGDSVSQSSGADEQRGAETSGTGSAGQGRRDRDSGQHRPTMQEAMEGLAAQGFTPDEAARLLSVSDRQAESPEARAAGAELKRLRFAQWLVERGILNEGNA